LAGQRVVIGKAERSGISNSCGYNLDRSALAIR
jgi:hypothetical protein